MTATHTTRHGFTVGSSCLGPPAVVVLLVAFFSQLAIVCIRVEVRDGTSGSWFAHFFVNVEQKVQCRPQVTAPCASGTLSDHPLAQIHKAIQSLKPSPKGDTDMVCASETCHEPS